MLPRVTVIISTYNGERFLAEAIQSILNQTFCDFELIVVNDGSTDKTSLVLESFQDDRIRIVNNHSNLGIATSQNKAIALARGEYLALMDHDDVSLPERLRLQVEFLDSHPTVGMVGSACLGMDEDNVVKSIGVNPAEDISLKWGLLIYACPIAHTSLMVRRQAMEKIAGYSGDYLYAGDYELLSKLAATHEVANLSQPLVRWRMHSSSASSVHEDKLLAEARRISQDNIQAVIGNGRLDEFIWDGLRLLLSSRPETPVNISSPQVNGAISFLLQLQQKFYARHQFSALSIREHRRHLHWLWGKHFLALAFRRNGERDMKCRFTLLGWSTKFLVRRAISF